VIPWRIGVLQVTEHGVWRGTTIFAWTQRYAAFIGGGVRDRNSEDRFMAPEMRDQWCRDGSRVLDRRKLWSLKKLGEVAKHSAAWD